MSVVDVNSLLSEVSADQPCGEDLEYDPAYGELERAAQGIDVVPGLPRHGIGDLPANAMVAGFVPHGLVMKQSTLVIAHAGHGIVSKALYHGVPMILLPWNRDQPGVADRAARLGVAEVVLREDVNETSVKAAVSRVFSDAEYQERATSISKKIKVTNPIALACQLLEDFEM